MIFGWNFLAAIIFCLPCIWGPQGSVMFSASQSLKPNCMAESMRPRRRTAPSRWSAGRTTRRCCCGGRRRATTSPPPPSPRRSTWRRAASCRRCAGGPSLSLGRHFLPPGRGHWSSADGKLRRHRMSKQGKKNAKELTVLHGVGWGSASARIGFGYGPRSLGCTGMCMSITHKA